MGHFGRPAEGVILRVKREDEARRRDEKYSLHPPVNTDKVFFIIIILVLMRWLIFVGFIFQIICLFFIYLFLFRNLSARSITA